MTEDFTGALRDISGSESESEGLYDDGPGGDVETDGQTSDDARDPSDERQARRVMLNPAPDANAQELRKVLGMAQLTFSNTRAKLLDLTKRYNTLASEMKAQRSRKGGRKSNGLTSLDQRIVDAARKYCLLYHLWVPILLFPVKSQPGADVDPHGLSRWQTGQEGRTIAEQAELYQMLPSELHKSLRTYPEFSRIFSKAMTEERANIVKNIKDISANLFSDLDIKSTLFSGGRSLKALDPTLLALLKKPGDSEYTPISPILFTNPSQIRANDLFKSTVLVKIARVVMYGKAAISSNKKRGGPKGRGERMGLQTVTEGLISCTATIARYLLLHDPEFTVKGEATGIQYQNDFKLYLKLLLEPDKWSWAVGVIDFFNTGVFGSKSTQPASQSANDSTGTSSHVRSWEDELLSEIGNDVRPPASPSYLTSFAISNPGPPSAARNVIAEPSALQFPLPGLPSEPVYPSISNPIIMPQVVPVNIYTASEVSFSGPVTRDSVAMSNVINADLQVKVARLSINPGPPTLVSGRQASKNTAASGSRSKAKALAAYPADGDYSESAKIRSMATAAIIPAIPAVPTLMPTQVKPTAIKRTTRSKKKAT